jgi:hypothetical protein
MDKFVIRKRLQHGTVFWRRVTPGTRCSSWVRGKSGATIFELKEVAQMQAQQVGGEVVLYGESLPLQQSGLPASEFIQEWPENKLTVAELQSVVEAAGESIHTTALRDENLERAHVKLKAALNRAKEKN